MPKLKPCGARAKSFKFVPVICMPEMNSEAVPVFVTTTAKGRLCVLMTWPGKIRGVGGVCEGEMETAGAVAVLLRLSVSVCCVGFAPTVYVTRICAATLVPGAVGL